MQILLTILIFIAKVLILIGDFVIFLFTAVKISTKKFLREAILNYFYLKLKIQLKLISLLLKSSEFLESSIHKPKSLLKSMLSNNLSKDTKNNRASKSSNLFSLSLIQQVKYFFFGVLFSLIFIFVPSLFIIFIQDLPNPKRLTVGQNALTTKIYDKNGFLLYQIYANHNRTIVPLKDIPLSLQEATIAIEDKDFYIHPGFDISAIVRSIYVNLSGKSLQGGSTITQQLIKSTLLNPETSISRKVKEVILAFWAERIYSKTQILEMYFNNVPYGGTTWGIETAAQTYFGKSVKDLTLSESAFLAGMPKAPTTYSPYGLYPDLWKKRQKEVLARMTALGYISKEQQDTALQEKIVFNPPQIPIYAPHFVMYVKELLVKRYGLPMVEKGGLLVKTSIDIKMQKMAESIVSDEVNKNAYLNLNNGAAVITNPKNGDILAMVGSKNFSDADDGSFNVTTSARQPGSSIKVITYSEALSKGFTAATILDDSPITYKIEGSTPYSPVNYDGKFHGKIPLRLALANSFNIPAVKTLNQIGIEQMINLAKRMGIKGWKDSKNYGLSITLGAAETTMLEMATVYGVLANGGERVDLNPLLEVTDYAGNILEKKDNVEKIRVLTEEVTFILSDILADNMSRAWEFGTNSPLNIPNRKVPVKTGTSDNKRDNWTIGYTPSYVTAVWVGNNDNSPMSQNLASGITGAAPIWNKIMTNILKDQKEEKSVIPQNIIKKACNGKIEYFIKGTENSVNCSWRPFPSPTLNTP